jgi:hypothetical protein
VHFSKSQSHGKICLVDNWEAGMGRGQTVVIAFAAIVFFCGATSDNIPEEVAAHTKDMADTCKQAGGTPQSDPFVERGNLADGLEFWAINEGAFRCDGATGSLFSGSGGSLITVYLVQPNGHAKEAFAILSYGMTIERTGKVAKLWLKVGGRLCGQKGNPTHGEAIGCERPLRWDASTQKLDFAPLSQVRLAEALRRGTANQLDVPVIEQGGDGQVANCGSSMVSGLKATEDGFLAVRSGPGSQYRQLDQLHNGDVVTDFEHRGEWVGIVYGTPDVHCSSTKTQPVPYDRKGWVHQKWLKWIAG